MEGHTGSRDLDVAGLRALFSATGGLAWQTSWNLGTEPQTWHGVKMNAEDRVVELDLRSNNLRGRIPKELGDLSKLEILCLRENQLTGPVPPNLGNLAALMTLDVSENQLRRPIPEELGALSKLKNLMLDNNQLGGAVPESLGNLKKLHYLWLFTNSDLTGPIPASLGSLESVVHMYLGQTAITGTIPPVIGSLPNLEDLDISTCPNLTGPIPEELGKARKLRELKLFNSNLSGTNPPSLVALKSLKILKVSGNTTLTTSDVVVSDVERVSRPYPKTINVQGALLEAPLAGEVHDCLHFEDYAQVIAEHILAPTAWPVGVGIFAKWGAGKSSLLKLILGKLSASGSWRALRRPWCEQFLSRFGPGTLAHALCTHFSCCCRTQTQDGDEEDPDSVSPEVTSIVASFDAWLFADSDVLWAVLISEIFQQGAVRATRVRHAVDSFTCMDWAVALFTAVAFAALTAIVVVVGREIGDLDNLLVEAIAWLGLAGVPLSLFMCAIKALPLVFKGQGEHVLSEARSMGESAGSAHLGFMAEVRDEMQVLLGMIEAKCTEKEKYVLVISIDNLDRCPHRQRVKVLHAVHLLLEHEETNVVLLLASDPRVVIAAIEADMDHVLRQEVSGAEYLDKIIHWPFCIPFATANERLNLIGNWLNASWTGSQAESISLSRQATQEPNGTGEGELAPTASNRGWEPADAEVARETDRPIRTNAHSSHEASSVVDATCESETKGDIAQPGSDDAREEQGTAVAPEVSGRPQRDTPHAHGVISQGRDDDSTGESHALAEGGGPAMPGDVTTAQPGGHQGPQQGSHGNVSFPAGAAGAAGVGGPATMPPVPPAGGSGVGGLPANSAVPPPPGHVFHTQGELTEFQVLAHTVVTTPRKLKRVCNIYSIQRALAIKMVPTLSEDGARKLLRWNFISEFWPFRASCLIGSITVAELPQETLASIYRRDVATRIGQMIGNRMYMDVSAAGGGDPSEREVKAPVGGHDATGTPPAWTAARRHLSIDESDKGIIRFLESTPQLLVEDFHEQNLGLLRLSFNLNPAMVASVSSWTRANW